MSTIQNMPSETLKKFSIFLCGFRSKEDESFTINAVLWAEQFLPNENYIFLSHFPLFMSDLIIISQ